MSKNILIGIVVVLLLGLGLYFYTQQGSVQTTTPSGTETPLPTQMEEAIDEVSDEEEDEGVVIINLEGFEFGFSMQEIKVSEGDTVRVVLENTGTMPHNFIIDEFDVATETILPGSTDTVEFVADAAGTYDFYCSIGNHRQLGFCWIGMLFKI